jgi:dynein heavy chain, axonemal
MEWTHWAGQVPTWTYPAAEEKPKFAQLIIPTLDSVRLEKLLHLSYSVDRSSLLVSERGWWDELPSLCVCAEIPGLLLAWR